MFGIGMPELIIILVITFLVIGPHKMPELARTLGKGLAEFKNATDDLKSNLQQATRIEEEKPASPQEVTTAGNAPAEASGQVPRDTPAPVEKKTAAFS
jgi:TatA/E family protein of Tat protein translocase